MDIQVNFKAGGSFVELAPQFSANAENVYVAWKNKVLGYNVKTGAQFAEFKGIKDVIVGFGVHYVDSYECVTACSSSGEVVTWKVVTFFKLLNKKLKKTLVKSFHIIDSEFGVQALVSYDDHQITKFSVIDVTNNKEQTSNLSINSPPLKVHVCGNKFFAVCQKKALNVVRIRDLGKVYTYCIDRSREFTCLECHPDNEMILTGDNTGRVVVWQNIFTSKPTKAVFHWHTLPVNCIGFSTSGTYFFSGADECVLVRWQLDNHLEKKFLPRLPSSIVKITVSPNNTYIAIATSDNAVRIVDARFENVSLVQNLVIGSTFESGMVVDPKTRALIMNGNVGQIQFYLPFSNSLLYNVDVVGQNKVSNERTCKIENTQVVKIAISKSGLWMATVERRRDPEYSSELRLKFWNFDLSIQNFKLNTCVEDPHEGTINAIAFQPTKNNNDLKLVTVGGDKKFKVWFLTEIEKVNNTTQIWKCLCVGFYHDLMCKDLSFSIDGSLIAVTFGNILTTWVPDSCQLKCTLSHPVCEGDINQVEFGNSNQCHLLVAASSDRLCVWNLLTLTMIWTVPVKVSILIADTITTNMAIITKENLVFVFSPSSPEPVYSNDKLLNTCPGVLTAAFAPSKFSNDARLSWHQRSPIFFIDSKQELYCLGSEEDTSDTPLEIIEDNRSFFSKTIPEIHVDRSKSKKPVDHLYRNDVGLKNLNKYLEAPTQTVLPIRIMCASLLKSMVLQKNL